MSFDRIIAGVDDSDLGFEALRQALAVRAPGAAVHAVTVAEDYLAAQTGFDATRVAAELADEAERTHQRVQELIVGEPGVVASVTRGNAAAALLAACQREQASLLAVGARHHSRAAGNLLGATSTTVLHDAPCPVLLARPGSGTPWQPRRIVVGVDGSVEALAALAAAGELAARVGSAVTVVSATGGKAIQRDQAWAARVDVWADGAPIPVLLDLSAEADLLFVGSRGLHGLRALGSVSERLAHRAACSVLVVRSTAYGDGDVEAAPDASRR